MTATKNSQKPPTRHSVAGRSRPVPSKGKTLEQFKREQRLALDKFRKECGG